MFALKQSRNSVTSLLRVSSGKYYKETVEYFETKYIYYYKILFKKCYIVEIKVNFRSQCERGATNVVVIRLYRS